MIGVIGPESEARDAIPHQRRNTAPVGHHRDKACGHRLQHHQAERFDRAQVQKQIGPGHFTGHITAKTNELHVGVRAASALT